ncbi:MAG: phosphatase PAP2 family protein, partial [Candidatus Kapaibacterium sp.]
ISPLTYSFAAEYKPQFQTNAIMYLETMSLNYGLNSITKSIVGRYRPFSYDTATVENVLYDYDTRYSFYSGHSSTAFASAVFNIIILTSQSGGLNKTIGVTLNIVNATAIATLRVMAGKHFFSDVIVGALVGSGIAYLTTELHKDALSTNTNEFEPMRFNFSIPF